MTIRVPPEADRIRAQKRRSAPGTKPDLDALADLALADGPPVIVDSREQLALPFKNAVRQKLDEGDYASVDLVGILACERKSHVDLAGSCGNGSERFEREMARLAPYRWKFLIIEASMPAVLAAPPEHSRMHPVATFARVIQWCLRYGVVPLFCGDRRHAKYTIARLIRAARRELAREAAEPAKGH